MDRKLVLREVLRECGVTQSELSRLSGVRQPSISQFLSGRTQMSDDMLDRLLCCVGYRLEVVRRPVRPELTRSEDRSWRLHRQLSCDLDPPTFQQWWCATCDVCAAPRPASLTGETWTVGTTSCSAVTCPGCTASLPAWVATRSRCARSPP
jgi:transcriptional regulator with XRE-family HTH domain